jgi:hypothetical protein
LEANIVKPDSNDKGKARTIIAFLFLFVFVIAVSAGVYYLRQLQEDRVTQEGQAALQAIAESKQIDEALQRYPSNRFLKLMALAANAEIETGAAIDKLLGELEPAALSKRVNFGAMSRNELEAVRRDLKTAEANAAASLPRYAALIKSGRDRFENDALALGVGKDVTGRFVNSVDKRNAETTALVSKTLSARAELYSAYEKCAAVLVAEFGTYKLADGQLIFPYQRTADRYNVVADAMSAATKRVAELEEEQKTLRQSHLDGWEQLVSGN